MTTLLNWAAGSSMPKDSEEAALLDRIQEVDSAVFNLMKNPQKDIEFDKAREDQFDMIQSGRLDSDEAFLQNYFNQQAAQPKIPVVMPEFTPTNTQLSKAVQQQLATGTIDDAINQKMLEKGLGSLQ